MTLIPISYTLTYWLSDGLDEQKQGNNLEMVAIIHHDSGVVITFVMSSFKVCSLGMQCQANHVE